MTEQEVENIRSRTDAKLRYAQIHLDELTGAGNGGSDFERAHLESYLFHLFGARDAFLGEVKKYYQLDEKTEIKLGAIRDALAKGGHSTAEVAELYAFERSESGWYRTMKNFRDHSTHVGPPRHHFTLFAGSEKANLVELEDPLNGERLDRNTVGDWLVEMTSLLERLRNSAISTTASNESK